MKPVYRRVIVRRMSLLSASGKAIFFYGARTKKDLCFEAELHALEERHASEPSQITVFTGDLQKMQPALADSLMKPLTVVEEEVYQVKNRSGQDPLNYPIKLNNKRAALGGIAGSAEADAFAELSARVSILKSLGGGEDLGLVFPVAPYTHDEWRRAAHFSNTIALGAESWIRGSATTTNTTSRPYE